MGCRVGVGRGVRGGDSEFGQLGRRQNDEMTTHGSEKRPEPRPFPVMCTAGELATAAIGMRAS